MEMKQNPICQRPIILDPVDPTHNVAEGYRWDILAQRASQCLKQDCCYDSEDFPISSWNVKCAQDVQVTVELGVFPDLILWMNPHDPIATIIEKIRQQRRRAYSGQQSLSFQELGRDRQVLSPQSSLADYGIFTNVHLQLLETFPPELQVFVWGSDRVSRAYTIHPNCYIRSLKQQIEAREGLMLAQQRLQFRGQNLQDWSTLGACGIQDNDTLVLSRKREGELS